MSSVSKHKSQFEAISENLREALNQVSVPAELQNALLDSVDTMTEKFIQNDLRPSELHGGDFIEASVRVLQFVATGVYTPLGRTLPNMPNWIRTMEASSLDDSLRINVPKALDAMYAIRNRRGVSHIAGKVSANKPDAIMLLTTTRWILAEFVRIFHNVADHEQAQRAVDLLAMVEVPLIENFEGVRRVISTRSVAATDQILILLATAEESVLKKLDLEVSIRSSKENLKRAITRLEQRDLIHVFNDNRIKLTGLGRSKAIDTIHNLIP